MCNQRTALWNLISKDLEVSKLNDMGELNLPKYWKRLICSIMICAVNQNAAFMAAAQTVFEDCENINTLNGELQQKLQGHDV